MKKIEAVIFDLDGTLIDSMGIWMQVDKEYLMKRDIIPPENLFDDIEGGNSYSEIAQYFKTKFQLPDSIEEIMQEWSDMVFHHYQSNIALKPGASAFIDFLKKQDIKLAIGTSNQLELAEIVLERNAIRNDINAIVSGCMDLKGKPYPDIFLKAAELLKINPEKCLVIEDVLVGVLAAKNAGMSVYAIADTYSIADREEIIDKADFFALDFNQLLEFFKINFSNTK